MFFAAFAASTWTVTTQYSSSIDLKAADIDEFNPGTVKFVMTGATSGGSATILLALQDSADNSTFNAVTPMGITSAAIAFDDAQWRDGLRFTLPMTGLRRYVRLAVTVGTAVLTAGVVNAGLVK